MELLSSLHHNTFTPKCSRGCLSSCIIQSRRKIVKSSLQLRKGSVQAAGVAARPLQVDLTAADKLAEGSIKWGYVGVQGPRAEMEDDIVLRMDELNGFTYAAVFDGHAGFSSVKFLRDELYKKCATALQQGSLLESKDLDATRDALRKTFLEADSQLLSWIEETGDDVESGSTATVMFVGGDRLIVSHIGDSAVVISRSGKAVQITNPHRPYGNSKVSLNEIRRVKEAGGWVINGRICGEISVSRAFGDMRFKTKKKEMLEEGVRKGRWTQKFVSKIKLNGDWVTASPDVYHTQLGPDTEFILLASDGLWDCMNSVDAVRFVRNQLRQHGDVQSACEALANAALNRDTQDNVSVVIGDLGRIQQQDGAEEEQNLVSEFLQAAATVAIVSFGIWLSYFFSQELVS
uniref:protein-serine/threonine phosphatase n=1 Tax=Araucaria cunninghamii TaxID=56994 RepID=A0A0D6R063_ARACU